MRLTAENTAIVLDSTADLPDAADRSANWRVVPLYVRFGEESPRDGVDIDAAEFYRRPSPARHETSRAFVSARARSGAGGSGDD